LKSLVGCVELLTADFQFFVFLDQSSIFLPKFFSLSLYGILHLFDPLVLHIVLGSIGGDTFIVALQ
jgi:hypothetical protein